MSKLIRHAGFSRVADGTLRFRTATTPQRIQHLRRIGEQPSLVELKTPVRTKSQAAKQLLAQGDRWLPEAVELFVVQAKDDNPFAKPRVPKAVVKVKSTKEDPVEAYFMAAEFSDVKLTPRQAAKLRAEFNERVRQAYEAN